METKPFPENTSRRFFSWIAIPLIAWSALCFWLILTLDNHFAPNASAFIGITIGIFWLASGIGLILLGKRFFLPDQRSCPTCGKPMQLKDDGEKTFYFYPCANCQIRWQTNLNRGVDD
ncbi:MAG: hypothetical protein ACIAXF_09400 [Phycisphaerales bacterium JB063]